MQEYSGYWKSDKYPRIRGIINISIPKEIPPAFQTTVRITYSETSPVRAGEARELQLSAVYGIDNRDLPRIIMRKTELKLGETFSCTLIPNVYTDGWDGQYACVVPFDLGTFSIRKT